MNSATIKTWLIRGEFEKLEHLVLEGRGARLLGEHSHDLRTRVFLKSLPNYLTKINQVHDAVTNGSLAEVQKLITSEPKKKYAIAKDSFGIPLLHKAVYNDHQDIVEWLVQNYPLTARQKDREGRTALHYCAACSDPEIIWDILIDGGCDASICDKRGHPAAYYLEHTSEISLSDLEIMEERKSTNGKTEVLDLKPSNIRIWIHSRDIAKLQQVVWEGHGSKLRLETSNNPRVRRFLEAVPFIMVAIKQIHSAVIKNDVDGLIKKIDSPVAPVILCAKDNNGLNVLHKAAGLGYMDIAKEIVDRYPQATIAQDNDGKTPLHYAAGLRDNSEMYDLLVEHGADESKLDNKHKAAAFYKNRPGDIDLSNLVVIPDAPRVSGSNYPKNWDWRILDYDGLLPRSIKKRLSPVDADSAFGSAESALKSPDSTDNVFGIKEADDGIDVTSEPAELVANGEDEPAAEEDAENAEPEADVGDADVAENDEPELEPGEEEAADDEPEPENDGEADQNDEPEAAMADEDEDVIEAHEEVGDVADEADNNNEADEAETNEVAVEDVITPEQEEEKNEVNGDEITDDEQTQDEEIREPSTGDSGVDETRIDEDQVIAGEHEELSEVDLNDGTMPDDPEVDDLLVNGNMEQLAALVLNGEGKRLVARQSSNPELQAFIDNVPSYIGKIHAVHIAAKEGNLRDLQGALDRRKFAVARDNASPHGATPLHVAVIFGHTAVVRYLAGRFPETAHAVDIDGRTPLHYAATLADNGHYYNLLLHLGANPLMRDNFDQKADYYKENHDDLSHKQLLRDFGAREELADEMLSDKVPGGDIYSSRREMNEADTMATLERCFRLLANTRRNSVPNTPSANAGTMLGRCLKRPIFDRIKHRVTRMDHNLIDVIWPSLQKYHTLNSQNASNMNSAQSALSLSSVDNDFDAVAVAPDYESYFVFAELFDPLIRNLHCVTTTGELPDHPLPHFFTDTDTMDGNENLEEILYAIGAYDIDTTGKYVVAATIEACRNLEHFSLPLTLTINQLEETEKRIIGILISPEVSLIMAEGSSEDEPGNYYTLNEVLERPSDIRVRLTGASLLTPIIETEMSDEKRLHGKHWPYGRGVYVAAAGDLAIWVNVQDHLRIICCTSEHKPGQIGKAYVRIAKLLTILDQKFVFKRDIKLGFLSARPSAIGNTMRFNVMAKMPGLSRKSDNLRNLSIVRGLRAMDTMRSDIFKISNQQCLSITELQTLQDFIRAIVNIIGLEKEMILTNSINIASLIVNMFKKKKSSARICDANVDIPIFREEEGRYLASSLGDPLIKGLTKVAQTRPKDPVTYLAKYLYNFANKTKSANSTSFEKYDVLIIPEREQENFDVEGENVDDDAGYPKSPESTPPESAFENGNRDEHGQSILHFTAVRSHPKDGFFHIMQERQINVGYRDELYRTARDVADESNFTENVQEIDRFVVYLAARGETEKLVELLLEGYEPILGIEDDGVNIVEIAAERNREATVQFLQSIPNYTSQRDDIHRAIRAGDLKTTKKIFEKNGGGGTLLAVGKNSLSRCSLHIAVLGEHADIVEFIVKTYPETLRIGDNLDRTALHYAMGVPTVEILSAILIKAGAKRVHKDLKSRQPTYYFMNKTDIQRLQEEEQTMAK